MRALSIVLLLCLLVTGCAPSLRPEPGNPTTTREECEDIDSSQQTRGTISFIAGLFAFAGLAAVFSTSDENSKLARGGALVGTFGGVTAWGASNWRDAKIREYRDKKCAAYSAASPSP